MGCIRWNSCLPVPTTEEIDVTMSEDQRLNNRYNADDMVEMILMKYSSPSCDETHCAKSELKRDLVRLISDIVRSEQNAWEQLESWQRIQRMIAEDNKPFLQKFFRRAS